MKKSSRTLAIRRTKHEDDVVYTAWVLWLIGFSETQIAGQLGIRKKQVSGIILQSDYSNRRGMNCAQRQTHYDDLISKRFDEGGEPLDKWRLRTLPDKVIEIGGR